MYEALGMWSVRSSRLVRDDRRRTPERGTSPACAFPHLIFVLRLVKAQERPDFFGFFCRS